MEEFQTFFDAKKTRNANMARKLLKRRKATPGYKRKWLSSAARQLTVNPPRYLRNPVRGRIISQLKFNQLTSEFSTENNVWNSLLLNDGIGVGTGQKNARSGDKIVVEKIMLRIVARSETPAGTETWPTTESNNVMIVRYVIVEDKQANGAAALSSDVFDTAFSTVQRFNNLGNRERFNILADRTVNYTQGHKAGGMEEFYIKKPVITTYDTTSTSGTISQIKTGSIYLFTTCMKAWGYVGSDVGMTLQVASRIRYTDM